MIRPALSDEPVLHVGDLDRRIGDRASFRTLERAPIIAITCSSLARTSWTSRLPCMSFMPSRRSASARLALRSRSHRRLRAIGCPRRPAPPQPIRPRAIEGGEQLPVGLRIRVFVHPHSSRASREADLHADRPDLGSRLLPRGCGVNVHQICCRPSLVRSRSVMDRPDQMIEYQRALVVDRHRVVTVGRVVPLVVAERHVNVVPARGRLAVALALPGSRR